MKKYNIKIVEIDNGLITEIKNSDFNWLLKVLNKMEKGISENVKEGAKIKSKRTLKTNNKNFK